MRRKDTINLNPEIDKMLNDMLNINRDDSENKEYGKQGFRLIITDVATGKDLYNTVCDAIIGGISEKNTPITTTLGLTSCDIGSMLGALKAANKSITHCTKSNKYVEMFYSMLQLKELKDKHGDD